MTSRGFKEAEFEKVTNWIVEVLKSNQEEVCTRIKEEVQALTANYPLEAQI